MSIWERRSHQLVNREARFLTIFPLKFRATWILALDTLLLEIIWVSTGSLTIQLKLSNRVSLGTISWSYKRGSHSAVTWRSFQWFHMDKCLTYQEKRRCPKTKEIKAFLLVSMGDSENTILCFLANQSRQGGSNNNRILLTAEGLCGIIPP